MKRTANIFVILTAGLILSTAPATMCMAVKKGSDVKVKVVDVTQHKDSINAELEIAITGRTVAKREQLRLYPAIKYGENETLFTPVAVNGKIKDKLLRRKQVLAGYNDETYASIRSGCKPVNETIKYKGSIPAEEWMKDACVGLVHEKSNCRGEYDRVYFEVIAPNICRPQKPTLEAVYSPVIPFIKPPREEIKSRAAAGEANIVYTVGNAEIKPALGDNYNELTKIQHSIDKVKTLPGAQIKVISISSYASPEGKWESNRQLSERRAASLTEWVRRNNNIYGIDFSARGYGEDWERLGEMVEKDAYLTRTDKEYVMALVNGSEHYDARESRLKRYNEGQTYRYLLNAVFPTLRRSAYRIEYTLPEYTLERSREIYRTHPQSLSLQELYALAGEHEPGSEQFVEILDNAARLFPGEKTARLNMAAANLSSGNTTKAREILNGLENEPDALIYFGILAAKEGDLDSAEAYFRKAERNGVNAAQQLRYLGEYRTEYETYRAELKKWQSTYGLE